MDQAFSLGVLDAEFYENITKYVPDSTYRDIAVLICGSEYIVDAAGFWTSMTPPDNRMKEAGWKIHVSALPEFAEETLRRALPLLSLSKAAFKLCSDEQMLRMSLNKNWPRQQAGKFITVYPKDDSAFQKLTAELSSELKGLAAPRILSDRQYSQDSPVYYRFGEHLGTKRRNDQGYLQSGYHVDGVFIEDSRGIYAPTPRGVRDPFDEHHSRPVPKEIILKEKYRVVSALKFSSLGGIYVAINIETDEKLVLREARRLMGYGKSIRSVDPFHVIKKEANILRKLDGLGVTPRFVDFFIEDGHAFLVQEKVDGESFWAKSVAIMLNDKLSTVGETWGAFLSIFGKIAQALNIVHNQDIVLRDLTRTNVIVSPDDSIRFIDLEFAHDRSRISEGWLKGFTPGYASGEQREGNEPAFPEDYYAYGALLVEMLTMCASGLELNAKGVMKKLRQNILDLGFPQPILQITSKLLAEDPLDRITPTEASIELHELVTLDGTSAIPHYLEDGPLRDSEALQEAEILRVLAGIDLFFENYADFSRHDRLWPVSAQGFMVHPGALDYGALGPAFYLHTRGKLSGKVVDWITASFSSGQPPSGLMSGHAGLALFYGALLDKSKALSALEAAVQRPPESSGLFYGMAGIGLVALHLFVTFNDPVFLCYAHKIAGNLESRANHMADVCWWPDKDGTASVGLGQGASGIALFFLYFGRLTSSDATMQLARAALKHDIGLAVKISGYTLFQPRTNSKSKDPNSPHLLYGSAGVGAVAARFLRIFPDDKGLRETVSNCAFAIRQRLTNKFWQYHGLSGIGEYALDLYQLGISEEKSLPRWLADGILPMEYEMKKGGIAFPGESIVKICGDYAMGTAGVGIFMNRLQQNSERFLFLDVVLE